MFVCIAAGSSPLAAWYYSTATSLDLQDWTVPQIIQNSQFPVTVRAALRAGSTVRRLVSFLHVARRCRRPHQIDRLIFYQNGCGIGTASIHVANFYHRGWSARARDLIGGQCGRRKPRHCAEYLGGDQGFESGSSRRFAHLARVGFCEQPDADRTRWCQRHGERQDRLRVLHQPHAGEYSDSARGSARVGPGASLQQRASRRGVYRWRRKRLSPSFFVSMAGLTSPRCTSTEA